MPHVSNRAFTSFTESAEARMGERLSESETLRSTALRPVAVAELFADGQQLYRAGEQKACDRLSRQIVSGLWRTHRSCSPRPAFSSLEEKSETVNMPCTSEASSLRVGWRSRPQGSGPRAVCRTGRR